MNRRELLVVLRQRARRWALPLGMIALSAVAGSLDADTGGTASDKPSQGRADRVVPGPSAPLRRKDDEKPGERLREGTRLADVAGSFQFAGDRVTFHPDGKAESYKLLENLALERVSRELGQARGTQNWIVSGLVTEFRNSNYLLVTKAVVRSAGETTSGP